jgi:hypothetical protein
MSHISLLLSNTYLIRILCCQDRRIHLREKRFFRFSKPSVEPHKLETLRSVGMV